MLVTVPVAIASYETQQPSLASALFHQVSIIGFIFGVSIARDKSHCSECFENSKMFQC